MGKTKTSHKQGKYSKSGTRKMKIKEKNRFTEYSPTQELMDENFIAKAIWECLKNNDAEGILEVIEAHLEAVNKVNAAHKTKLPRSTMYKAFKGKNPTIKTLAKLVNCCL